MNVTVKNATLITGEKVNIVIENGYIKEVGEHVNGNGEVLHVEDDVFVSAGWIDLHTHAFPKHEPYCAHPDDIGYKSGVTTVVDAGSSGADDIDEFIEMTSHCKTRVLAYLNVSSIGLRVRNELSNMEHINEAKIKQALDKHAAFIVGLKARMSGSVVGENGIKPLVVGKEISRKLSLPVMVHIGNAPPTLLEVIKLLEKGDVITHCFNGKEDNHIFANNEANIPALLEAVQKGVFLDIGHGMSSFSHRISKQAKEKQIPFHTISTDVYEANRVNGPVYDLATTMMKFTAIGYSVEEIIDAVTVYPATVLRRDKIGTLKPGAYADLTFFKVHDKQKVMYDSYGEEIVSPITITPYAVMIGGEYNVCTS